MCNYKYVKIFIMRIITAAIKRFYFYFLHILKRKKPIGSKLYQKVLCSARQCIHPVHTKCMLNKVNKNIHMRLKNAPADIWFFSKENQSLCKDETLSFFYNNYIHNKRFLYESPNIHTKIYIRIKLILILYVYNLLNIWSYWDKNGLLYASMCVDLPLFLSVILNNVPFFMFAYVPFPLWLMDCVM